MSKKLFKFSSNWADEMDVYSYAIVDTKESLWADYKKIMDVPKDKRDEEGNWVCIGVGSNEELEYDTVQELLDEISVKNLTDEEASIITKKLGKEWGNPSIDYLIEAASEALFENDDEDEDY